MFFLFCFLRFFLFMYVFVAFSSHLILLLAAGDDALRRVRPHLTALRQKDESSACTKQWQFRSAVRRKSRMQSINRRTASHNYPKHFTQLATHTTQQCVPAVFPGIRGRSPPGPGIACCAPAAAKGKQHTIKSNHQTVSHQLGEAINQYLPLLRNYTTPNSP